LENESMGCELRTLR